MNKIITLGIFLSLTLTSFSQKLDYDNDSKWFFGLNVGAAWNTTDVKNQTDTGWGALFGRSFNYNYGRKVSFDLRLRYLSGNWYGQDYDTTSLLGYNSEYNAAGNVSNQYDSLGYTINNFQTEVQELGLELAIHLNALRETTGWDPYVFGGANIVVNQTYGDLVYTDSLSQNAYDYSPYGISKPEWRLLSDGIYDMALDGSQQEKFNVDFMPSLGFGLGYQVSPQFAVGIEHKTTFAMKDVFDGYVNPEERWGLFENDVYHYTSAYLKFNLRKRSNYPHIEQIPLVERPPAIEEPAPCLPPVVSIVAPESSVTSVQSKKLVLKAIITNIDNASAVTVKLNGEVQYEGVYNSTTKLFTKLLELSPRSNSIEVSATNDCGKNTKVIRVSYQPCSSPTISILSPRQENSVASTNTSTIKAKVTGVSSVDELKVTVNGMLISGGSYVAQTGLYSNVISLKSGKNVVVYTVTNSCGAVSAQSIITNQTSPNPKMITICHKSGRESITMKIPFFEWGKHQSHGDKMGSCRTPKPEGGSQQKKE
jgi:large repetitive protein